MRLSATTGVLALLALTSGLAASACGGSSQASPTQSTRAAPTPRPPHRPRRRGRPRPPATPPGPRVGTTQTIQAQGTTLDVTITSVLDPLRGAGANVAPGMKAVGVLASVRDAGPAGYDGSATSALSLRSEAGPASPVFVATGPCQTQVQDFMNAIGPGQVRSGCVAFAIPRGRAPTAVRFVPFAGSRVSRSWFVPTR